MNLAMLLDSITLPGVTRGPTIATSTPLCGWGFIGTYPDDTYFTDEDIAIR